MSETQDVFEEEPEEPTTVTAKELAAQIDRWLDDARPERYEEGDDEWMEPVFKKADDFIRQHMNADERISSDARRSVRAREGQAVKSAHAELRKIARGEVPLGWPAPGEDWTPEWKARLSDLLHLPLKVGGGGKVQLCVMSPQDWRDWRLESQRVGDEDQKRRIEERLGAEKLETLGTQQGVSRTDEIRLGEAAS